MKAVYLVIFHLSEATTIEIGALGEIDFRPGYYIYAGSGHNSVESRLSRHMGSTDSKHWHIDYFSEEAEAVDYFILPEKSSYECVMASILDELGDPVTGFGCSDCKCSSHLFRLLPENF